MFVLIKYCVKLGKIPAEGIHYGARVLSLPGIAEEADGDSNIRAHDVVSPQCN